MSKTQMLNLSILSKAFARFFDCFWWVIEIAFNVYESKNNLNESSGAVHSPTDLNTGFVRNMVNKLSKNVRYNWTICHETVLVQPPAHEGRTHSLQVLYSLLSLLCYVSKRREVLLCMDMQLLLWMCVSCNISNLKV